MLRSRIKAFTTLLELIAQALLKGRPHVVAVARPSYASRITLHAGATSMVDTDVLFNTTSISIATYNETSPVDSAISAILSAGAPPSHLVPVTFTAGPVPDESVSEPTPEDQEAANATVSIDLELPLDSISDASVPEYEPKPCLQPIAVLLSLLALLAKNVLSRTSSVSTVLSRGFLFLRSMNAAQAIHLFRFFGGLLLIDRAFCSQEQAVMRLIKKSESRIQLLAFLAMCEARASFKTMLDATSHIVTLLPYLVLDKQTIRKLVKFVKTVQLIMLELRARRLATSDTITITDPERHVSLDLDDDIIIPPSDGISAAPISTMMRWSHFGRASSRPTSLSVRVVKYKETRKEREDLTDGHFDMSTLIEIYACRSTHFSHFGSLNKVPIINASTLESLDIEIDTPDQGSSPRRRLSHFGLTIKPYSAEESDASDTLRHTESYDPMFAVSSRLPGLYPESISCSVGDHSSGFRFFYDLFLDIKCELVAFLLSSGSWTAFTILYSANRNQQQVAESQVESECAVEVLGPVSIAPLPSVRSGTGMLVDAHVPLVPSSVCSVNVHRRKAKPSTPSEPDVFTDDIGYSSNRSVIKAGSISFGIPQDPYAVYGGHEFRPPDPSTLDTPTRWTSSAPPRSPTMRRWEGRRRRGGLEEEEDNGDFSVPPLSVWDFPYYPLSPRLDRTLR